MSTNNSSQKIGTKPNHTLHLIATKFPMIVILLANLIGSLVGGIIVFLLITNNLLPGNIREIVRMANQADTQIDTINQHPTYHENASLDPLANHQDAILSSLDEEWYEYKNYELEFALNVPKRIRGNINCIAVGYRYYFGNNSLREYEPLRIWQDQHSIYISSATATALTLPSPYPGNNTFYAGCEQMKVSLFMLSHEGASESILTFLPVWKISSVEADTTKKIEAFIDKSFAIGCDLANSDELASAQDVVDVKVAGDRMLSPDQQGACHINYKYVLKYHPVKKRLLYLNLGQDGTFLKPGSTSDTLDLYDFEMIDSLRFI